MNNPEFGFGTHLMIDGYQCDTAALQNMPLIHQFLYEYPNKMGMTKITSPYVFHYHGTVPEDWGISGFVLIAESHISIHTFPEKRYMSVDMFSCKPFDPEEAIEWLKKYFYMQKYEMKVLDRGQEFPKSIVDSESVVKTDRRLMNRYR